MIRRLLFLALVVLLVVLRVEVHAARADDEPAAQAPPHIAWFQGMAEARKVAAQTGRPLFVALHVRPRVASPEATQRLERWIAVYADPQIVALSRRCACVLRVIQAPEGKDPDTDRGPAAVHLVVDGASRVLARLDVDAPADGAAGVRQLRSILVGGLANFGAIAPDAPLIEPGMVARTTVDLTGISPNMPIGVPLGVPGVRLRLRWELPVPALQGAREDRVKAGIQMRWDGEGPFDVGRVAFGAGEEIDASVDVRFDEIEGLAPLATKGKHRVDLYLVPLPGSYPFSLGPLHVGRVWIDLGDGGGGGGGAGAENEEQQPEEAPPKPQPEPEVGEDALPPPPPPEREEVVQPFVNEGEAIEKDDAVVAVEDPDGGVKPPKQVPLAQALREFEKVKEREVSREGIGAGERAFLRRYFELLERAVKGGAKK